jgi:hypothetical protein
MNTTKDTALKKYRVECIQHYVDEIYTDTEVLYVFAYDREHAEEKAWEKLGGERGEVINMTFRATRAK